MHQHQHAPTSYNRAFAIGVALNLGFVIIEAVYGVLAGSLALVADAGHNLSDVVSLLLAWGAAMLARRRPTATRTYGYRKATVLAALGGAILLLIALGAIAWEAVGRFADPAPVQEVTVIVVAGIGVLVNAFTAWLFMAGRKRDLNLRSAYLHMAADAGVSVGVVVTGIVIMFTRWYWIDPAVSLAIVAIVLVGTWGLLRDSFNLAMDAVPPGIKPDEVRGYLESLPGVAEVHDLHIWAMSTTESAMTAHLVMPTPPADDGFLQIVAHELHQRFDIEHPTIQIERGEACELVRNDRV